MRSVGTVRKVHHGQCTEAHCVKAAVHEARVHERGFARHSKEFHIVALGKHGIHPHGKLHLGRVADFGGEPERFLQNFTLAKIEQDIVRRKFRLARERAMFRAKILVMQLEGAKALGHLLLILEALVLFDLAHLEVGCDVEPNDLFSNLDTVQIAEGLDCNVLADGACAVPKEAMPLIPPHVVVNGQVRVNVNDLVNEKIHGSLECRNRAQDTGQRHGRVGGFLFVLFDTASMVGALGSANALKLIQLALAATSANVFAPVALNLGAHVLASAVHKASSVDIAVVKLGFLLLSLNIFKLQNDAEALRVRGVGWGLA
eukprot:m.260677 g.260677  ORF g.260677 m.260677 type:complete len:316 (+) comp11042_c1_seq18:7618-8565(+)